jgi:hypothetical protein
MVYSVDAARAKYTRILFPKAVYATGHELEVIVDELLEYTACNNNWLSFTTENQVVTTVYCYISRSTLESRLNKPTKLQSSKELLEIFKALYEPEGWKVEFRNNDSVFSFKVPVNFAFRLPGT